MINKCFQGQGLVVSAMSNSDIDLNESRDLFSEAADYYQPDPDPSFTTFDREVDLVNVG